jgi:hypothetical protein
MDLLEASVFGAWTGSEEWRHEFLEGMLGGLRIAERVRCAKNLGRSDIDKDTASGYLDEVLRELQSHAESQAQTGYGRYRWTWYLRRAPREIFNGQLANTGPYDRMLSVVLATRGAKATHAVGSPLDDGTFPVDATVCNHPQQVRADRHVA